MYVPSFVAKFIHGYTWSSCTTCAKVKMASAAMAGVTTASYSPQEFLEIMDEFEILVRQVAQHFATASIDEKHSLFLECENMLGDCVIIEQEFSGTESESNMVAIIRSVADLVTLMEHSLIRECSPLTPGRPQVICSEQQLQFLVANDFCLADMACILNCSIRTVQRHLQEHGLGRRQRYCQLTDSDVDQQVSTIQSGHPDRGYRIIESILRSNGIFIQRRRI